MTLAQILACPDCRSGLTDGGSSGALKCEACGAIFDRDENGYLLLMSRDSHPDLMQVVTEEDYGAEQHHSGGQRVDRYLAGHVESTDRTVLDVGCGVGEVPKAAAAATGTTVYGIDVPTLSGWWAKEGLDPDLFVGGDAERLPFLSDTFDLVWSLGVIEHIGQVGSHSDWWDGRARYMGEMLRVAKPGGRVIVGCPNKAFPLDPAHNWGGGRFRQWLWDRTHLHLHRTWGTHELVSYGEVQRLAQAAGARSVRPLPLTGYFQFNRIGAGVLAPVVPAIRFSIERLPASVRRTGLFPFVMAEIHV